MTVKLSKFSNTNNGNFVTLTPPPLHPPNIPMITRNFFHQKQQSFITIQQEKQQEEPQLKNPSQERFNPNIDYNEEDADDTVSIYSTSTSIITSRDHPFNNSQRPLLAGKKPQLLNKKKIGNGPEYIDQAQLTKKSYLSPYFQQQKRDSAKGLHGFNDFGILSQQYTQHLKSPHIGYPYGSPPSPSSLPIANSNDFKFDTLPKPTKHKCSLPTSNNAISQTACSILPRYANINNIYGENYRHGVSGSEAITHFPTHRFKNMVHKDRKYNENSSPSKSSSRFEDDFCENEKHGYVSVLCRNESMETSTSLSSSSQCSGRQGDSGPFIFGQCDVLGCPLLSGKHGFTDNANTVLAGDGNYRNLEPQNGQVTIKSTSDTSSSSRDDIQIRKGTSKFLLRKRKSPKNNNKKENVNFKIQKGTSFKKPLIKCVVVGDGAVGKTNLILSYLENRFNTKHVPTAFDIYNAEVMVNESPVHLILCDTAGQDTLDPLRELCYPDSNVFLLCFSVTKPETFLAIKTKWAPKFSKTKASLILVGTQKDLRFNSKVINKLQSNGETPITYAEAWDFATTIGATYIETSSATQEKIKDVFDTAIWEGLLPSTLPPKPSIWKKIFCLV